LHTQVSRSEPPIEVSVRPPEPTAPSRTIPGTLRAAAIASLGAGAIHATAAGAHAEHRATVVAFAVVAVLQIGWGALALVRSGAAVGLAGVAINGAVLGGWVLAKTSGISFVDGLEAAEDPQFADTVSAALGVVAIVGAAAALIPAVRLASRPRPGLVGLAAAATIGLAVPGMVATGSHSHAGDDHAETAGHAAGGHDHAAMAEPKPFDGTLPVDLGGTPGVSEEEQREAEELVTDTIQKLPQFADWTTLDEKGWYPIGDAVTGFEHFINWPLIDDPEMFNPDRPESIVYEIQPDGTKKLVAAMFIAPRHVTIENPPEFGGELVQWHAHNNLCYGGIPNQLRIMAVVEYPRPCPGNTFRDHLSPMIHVWITPHECGPFASLEGDGGGVLAPGETRACDHAHGSH
jgi:hypothetical protein